VEDDAGKLWEGDFFAESAGAEVVNVKVFPGLKLVGGRRNPSKLGEEFPDHDSALCFPGDAAAGSSGLPALLIKMGIFSGSEFIDSGGEDANAAIDKLFIFRDDGPAEGGDAHIEA